MISSGQMSQMSLYEKLLMNQPLRRSDRLTTLEIAEAYVESTVQTQAKTRAERIMQAQAQTESMMQARIQAGIVIDPIQERSPNIVVVSQGKRSIDQLNLLLRERDNFLKVGLDSTGSTFPPSPEVASVLSAISGLNETISSTGHVSRIIRRPPIQDDEYLQGLNLRTIALASHEKADASSGTHIAILNATFQQFMPHRYRTRQAAQQFSYAHLQEMQRRQFNAHFRGLPTEIREMIFGFAIEYSGKSTPWLIIVLRGDQQLYHEALRALYFNNTFLLTRYNLGILNTNRKNFMRPSVWITVRSLTIRPEYMRRTHRGRFVPYNHVMKGVNGGEINVDFKFSPCPMCAMTVIPQAINLRVLHLDFNKTPHCIAWPIMWLCRCAVQALLHLERLELTLSNVRCEHSIKGVQAITETINRSMSLTGRLSSIGTKAFCDRNTIANDKDSATWFWQAERGGALLWKDVPLVPEWAAMNH